MKLDVYTLQSMLTDGQLTEYLTVRARN